MIAAAVAAAVVWAVAELLLPKHDGRMSEAVVPVAESERRFQ